MSDPRRHFISNFVAMLLIAGCGLYSIVVSAAGEIVIEDEAAANDELVIEDGSAAGEEDEIKVESGVPDEGDISIEDDTAGEQEDISVVDEGSMPQQPQHPNTASDEVQFSVDKVWLEYGRQADGNSLADRLRYGQLAASLNWRPQSRWELQLAGRVDGYDQDGQLAWTKTKVDYGDSFIRYHGDGILLTAGAETVIWGRMDEIPLSDRVSTADLTRFILDDLEDRRRATPMVRAQVDIGGGMLDLVWLYAFRAAELPDQSSIWYPVDKTHGRILGIDPADISPAVVRTTGIIEDKPGGPGGFGVRYTVSPFFGDIGITVAHTRRSTPYYRVAGTNFKTEYPRSWTLGADAAVDALGATWRAELVYNSDNPVTRSNLSYTTIAGLEWGMGVEMYPGDGDLRINLQLLGSNLLDPPSILDRTQGYSLNGEIEMPFDRERWRASLDFFVGLDQTDVYLNPEITFLGWEPHEFYLAGHYFAGDAQALGGFHEDHSSINLGWRAKF